MNPKPRLLRSSTSARTNATESAPPEHAAASVPPSASPAARSAATSPAITSRVAGEPSTRERYNARVPPTLATATIGNHASPERPVVFLHGAFVTHAMGRHALPAALLDRCPCLAVGLPGHPGSPLGAWAEGTAAGFADLLAATLDDAGVGDDAAVVGHSLGGLGALALASFHPHRVGGVACVSGTAGGLFRGGTHGTLLQRIAVLSSASPTAFRLGVRAGSCSRGLHRLLAGAAAGDAGALRRDARFRAAVDAYLPALWRAPTEPMRRSLRRMAALDLRDRLPGLTVPTLFLHGAADPVFPAAPAETAAAASRAATFAPLPGIGHLPMFESSDSHDAALCRWVASLPVRTQIRGLSASSAEDGHGPRIS